MGAHARGEARVDLLATGDTGGQPSALRDRDALGQPEVIDPAPGRRGDDPAVVDELEALDDRLGGGRRDPDLDRSAVRTERDDVARDVAIRFDLDESAGRHERPAGPDGLGPGGEGQRHAGRETSVRADGAERDLGRHLVGAAHDREPVPAIQEAIPLADRRPVHVRRQGLHLDRVDPARDDVRGDLRVRQWEVDGHDQPRLGAGRIRPVADQPVERVAQARLRGPGARHRQDGIGRPKQADVAEHVLAVLAAHHDQVLTGVVGDDFDREVGDAGVVVAPLRREQVRDRDALRPSLEERRGRRDEVDVRVHGDPTGARRARDRLERQDQRGTADLLPDVDGPRQRAVAEPAHHLDLDRAVRQRDGEPARDVRVGGATKDQVRPGVLVESGVDLVAVAEGREVSPVRRHEPDAGGHRFAAHRVHDLDVDPSRGRPQRLDDGPAELASCAFGRKAAGRDPVFADRDRRVRRHREIDESRRRPCRPFARRAPAQDLRGSSATGRDGRRRRPLPEHLAEIHLHLAGSAWLAVLDPQRPAGLDDQGRGGPPEGRDRRDDDRATGIERRQRLHLQPVEIRRAVRDLDRVQPQGDVAGRARHRIRHPGLGRTPAARQDPEQPGVARRGVAAGWHRRIRASPVERRVDEMWERGKGALAPPDDAVIHLESPAHDLGHRPTRGELDGVAGQGLAHRGDPADRQVRGTSVDRIAPGIAEVRDDHVADRSHRAQVQADRPVEQQPAPVGRGAGEAERQSAKDLVSGRQSSDRVEIRRVEPRTQVAIAGVVLTPQVRRGRQIRRPRTHPRVPAVSQVVPATAQIPPASNPR